MINKRIFTAWIVLLPGGIAKAQNVGVGTTTPHASAQLQIQSTNKGLLIPQVSLTNVNSTTPITSPAVGLLVFNTNGGMIGGTVGFYYWNGISWQKLQTQSGGWSTNGNSFLPGETPLLGSVTTTPLNFIMSNNKAGFIDSSNTHIGFTAGAQRTTARHTVAIGNGALFVNTTQNGLVAIGDSALYRNGAGATDDFEARGNTAVGYKSLKENTIGGDNTAVGDQTLTMSMAGSANTAVGTLGLNLMTSGDNNTAIGSYALRALVDGSFNTAVGSGALFLNKNSNNTAVGYQALFNNSNDPAGSTAISNNAFGYYSLYANRSGGANVAMGDYSLYRNRSGSGNVAVGFLSGSNNNIGLGNIFLGNRAGEFALSSNKLYIENSGADSLNALVYGDFSADSLLLNARVTVRDMLVAKNEVQVQNSSMVAFIAGLASASPGPTPVTGAGRRMMWYADKAAFRAGYVDANQWDAANVGNYSVALGRVAVASSFGTFAAGPGARAIDSNATAIGFQSLAARDYSVAVGLQAQAFGGVSLAMGANTRADGDLSTAIGVVSRAYGEKSLAIGDSTAARGVSSTALGRGTIAQSFGSMSVGLFNDTTTFETPGSWNPYERLFVVGNGNSEIFRSSALVILKNGNTDISGYTRLGTQAEAAPRIKTKKLANTSPAASAVKSIAHGLSDSKILAVNVLLDYGSGRIPPSYIDVAGYEYNIQVQFGNIILINKTGNSANIANKNVTILITYEE